jgi:lipoyl(octanoyl) transferase
VEALTCRLLPWSALDGPTNMAADEALVQIAAETGVASLRFYGWSPPTLSLGYFQRAAERLRDPRLAELPWVRRPSGGSALVHHHEITYALAVPPGPAWRAGGPWMLRMHAVIVRALGDLGVAGHLAIATAADAARHGDFLCFQHIAPGDVVCDGKKVVGSAQRKFSRALMQHGSILLEQSEHTPLLPGLREITSLAAPVDEVRTALTAAFAQETGWQLLRCDWTDAERRATRTLTDEKYGRPDWNERR